MISFEHFSPNRPYWHVDAKWITVLVLVPILGLTLLTYNLVQVTAEKPAIRTLSMVMALMYSTKGLDDGSEIAQFRQQLRASPDKSIEPIPGLRIPMREEEFTRLSPREARLAFMHKLAQPIYNGGAQGLAALANDPQLRKKIIEGGGSLNLLTRRTHKLLQRGLFILGAICLVLFVPLIFFSYRFGRLSNPGCAIFIASLPGAILFGIISISARSAQSTPPSREAGIPALASYVASNALPPLVQSITRNYLIFLSLGLGLMLLAFLSKFIRWLTHRRRAV